MNKTIAVKTVLLTGLICSAGFSTRAQPQGSGQPQAPIPMDQLGAVAGKQYQGDDLAIRTTPNGARLHCVFQRLEGEATPDGLWLRSTAEVSNGERLRVVAVEVGRADDFGVRRQSGAATPLFDNDWLATVVADFESGVALGFPLQSKTLPVQGAVPVHDRTARFMRPGLTEEYSVSMDGVRQDFIIQQRPAGGGELRVELHVTGATVEPLVNGARLTLIGSGRKLAYSRLHVTDAHGSELAARIEVTSANRLAILVNDVSAVYPVRIDPTFSDGNWISMGGFAGADKPVSATAVDGLGNLYVGGSFAAAGEVLVRGVAKWDGTSWSALALGLNGSVSALAVSGSDLYVGGTFTTATNSGGASVTVTSIAKWDGTSWSAMGLGLNGTVLELAVSGSDLYAGGSFTWATNSGGVAVTVNRIAKWDGTSWSALGSGMDNSVWALAVSGSDLYAGGFFRWATNSGGASVTVNRIAKWDGTSWSALGLGLDSLVSALAVSGSELYAGGSFTWATNSGGASVTVNRIAKWDGTSWSALGLGLDSSVSALAVAGSDLYAGGFFRWATNSGGAAVNVLRIAKWDGIGWSALSPGMTNGYFTAEGSVSALAVSGSVVYAGGDFVTAGGGAADNIARWNGSSWSALGSPGLNGFGFSGGKVSALAILAGELYAGGFISGSGTNRAGRSIAKWDGNSWESLGLGVSSDVEALAVSGSNIYVGGYFTTATNSGGDSVMVNRIAKWDGISWSTLGLGLNGSVNALLVDGTNLYVGGGFTIATNDGGAAISANGIARWDGSSWSSLGLGMNGSVQSLSMSGSNLYAGGWFTTASNMGGIAISVNYVAKWDGNSWSALGSGLNYWVYAVVAEGNDVYAGGSFNTATNSGGILVSTKSIAKWDGAGWSALGSGMNSFVDALALSGGHLYAGGYFTTVTNSDGGTVVANGLVKWDGSNWSAFGSGLRTISGSSSAVNSLAIEGNNLYVGGYFEVAGGKVSRYVAKAIVGGNSSPGQFGSLVFSPAAGFSFTFSGGTVGQSYRIQTSTSLPAGPWTDFTNFIYTVPIVINDSAAGSVTNKFFRAVTP